jgi:signal transduction histidine kinase
VEYKTGALQPLALVGFVSKDAEQWWADWRQQSFENLHLVAPDLLEQVQTDAVLVQEAAAPPFRERPNPFGIRQWLFAPLWADSHLAGALGLDDRGAERTYRPEEVALVKVLAHLGALLLERERLLEEREEARAHMLALREANQRLDTFLGLAGHELNTPLAVLTLQVELAQRRVQQALAPGGLERDERAERLQAAAVQLGDSGVQLTRMDRLVHELLDTSRIQAGQCDLHLQVVDVLALVREVVEEQRQLDPTRQIDVHLAAIAEGRVVADADRLGQVLTNYLTNARKYSPEAAPVVVGVECEAAEMRVWVRDQGPGLSLEQQERLWERFHRVPGIAVQSGSDIGLGLGLFLCRALIEHQGGHVGIQSSPGAGSTFWFTLPLARDNAHVTS